MASITPPEGHDPDDKPYYPIRRPPRQVYYEKPRKVSIFSKDSEEQQKALEFVKEESIKTATIAGGITATFFAIIFLFQIIFWIIFWISEALFGIVLMFAIIAAVVAVVRVIQRHDARW